MDFGDSPKTSGRRRPICAGLEDKKIGNVCMEHFFISYKGRDSLWKFRQKGYISVVDLIKCREHCLGVMVLKGAVEERAVELGEYIIENNATVRAAAKKFHISKSTVHKDVSDRLRLVNPGLYGQVRKVLEVNKAQRHIRGGIATREKYRHETE